MAPPDILFNWALPLVDAAAGGQGPPQGTRGALLALGAVVAHADGALLSRKGPSVVQALLKLLEGERTPVGVMPCALDALLQVCIIFGVFVCGCVCVGLVKSFTLCTVLCGMHTIH